MRACYSPLPQSLVYATRKLGGALISRRFVDWKAILVVLPDPLSLLRAGLMSAAAFLK